MGHIFGWKTKLNLSARRNEGQESKKNLKRKPKKNIQSVGGEYNDERNYQK